jgi:squalene synthase HpnC
MLSLEAADAYCRALAKGHYENFAVATGLVGKSVQRDLSRIYAFCRITDDLGDESASKAEALARLERWRGELAAMFAGTSPVHPALFALRETAARCRIPSAPFFDLIDANVMDQHASSYANWTALEAYCRLSAAPVGRMVLAVFGIDDPRAPALSDDVCIGLQLANHAQDVRRDALIGRCYLPQDEIAASETRGAVRAMVERAKHLLDSGRTLEPLAPFALRLQLSLYRLGGLAICAGIERAEYRTDEVRPVVDRGAKLNILLRALIAACKPEAVMEHAEATR